MSNVSAIGDPVQFHSGLTLKKTPIKIAIGVGILLLIIVIITIASKGQPSAEGKQQAETQAEKKDPTSASIPAALNFKGEPSIPAAAPPQPQTPQTSSPTGESQGQQNNNPDRPRPPSLEEQRQTQQALRLAEYRSQQLLAALTADTVIKINDSNSTTSNVSGDLDSRLAQVQEKAQALQASMTANPFMSSAMAAEQPLPQMQQTDPNGQARKEAFLSQKRSDDYLEYTRDKPLSRYELNVGTIIPAVLISGMNSDIPGALIAQISQNVYDSATGKHLLLPQGARLYGVYDSNVSYGQSRGVSAWTRINYPDGSRLNLAGMEGMDVEGYSGFEDEVDHHYWKTFGNAALLGMISGTAQAGISENSRSGNTKSAVADGVTQQFAQTGSSLIQKNLDVQPTIKIRPGYKFNIMVNKDIMLTPYKATR